MYHVITMYLVLFFWNFLPLFFAKENKCKCPLLTFHLTIAYRLVLNKHKLQWIFILWRKKNSYMYVKNSELKCGGKERSVNSQLFLIQHKHRRVLTGSGGLLVNWEQWWLCVCLDLVLQSALRNLIPRGQHSTSRFTHVVITHLHICLERLLVTHVISKHNI